MDALQWDLLWLIRFRQGKGMLRSVGKRNGTLPPIGIMGKVGAEHQAHFINFDFPAKVQCDFCTFAQSDTQL